MNVDSGHANFRESEILNQAETTNIHSQEKGLEYQSKVKSLSEEKEKLSAKMLEITGSKSKLQKKLAATRKHLLRSKKKIVETNTSTHILSDASKEVDSTKIVNTDLKGTKESLVKILPPTSSEFVFVSEKYPGLSSGGDQTHPGKSKYFAEILTRSKEDASRQELWRTARDGISLLNFASSADGSQNDENLKDMFVRMMRLKPLLDEDYTKYCIQRSVIIKTNG